MFSTSTDGGIGLREVALGCTLGPSRLSLDSWAGQENDESSRNNPGNITDSPSGLVGNVHSRCRSREFDSYQTRICVLSSVTETWERE